jgi:hypothetical protein
MMKNVLAMVAVLGSFGCVDKGMVDTGDPGDDTSDPGPGDPSSITVSWGAAALDVAIADGGSSYYFGWVENEVGQGCIIANGDNWCWSGEDCLLGFTAPGGGNVSYCHDAGQFGLDLSYYDRDNGCNDLVEGSETCASSALYESTATWYVEDAADPSKCWTGGVASTHYDGLGCN